MEKRKTSDETLARKALRMMKSAYAPYSGYCVGAALTAVREDGSERVYTGCNIEGASYSPTVCAERTAFFKAVSEGERHFGRSAVAGGKDGIAEGVFPPCGVCRQVMAEFCGEDFEILVVRSSDPLLFDRYTPGELLPLAFGPKYIKP